MALLALQESYSLSVLLYASPALSLTCKQSSELNVFWNGVIRRIFGYHKWESVRALICELRRLNVAYELLVCKLNFISIYIVNQGFWTIFSGCFYCRIWTNVWQIFSGHYQLLLMCIRAFSMYVYDWIRVALHLVCRYFLDYYVLLANYYYSSYYYFLFCNCFIVISAFGANKRVH